MVVSLKTNIPIFRRLGAYLIQFETKGVSVKKNGLEAYLIVILRKNSAHFPMILSSLIFESTKKYHLLFLYVSTLNNYDCTNIFWFANYA